MLCLPYVGFFGEWLGCLEDEQRPVLVSAHASPKIIENYCTENWNYSALKQGTYVFMVAYERLWARLFIFVDGLCAIISCFSTGKSLS